MPDADPLPPLRRNLEMMPSPVAGRPGLLIRDPYRYSEGIVIVPPPLVPYLLFFDGTRSELDLREALVRATGDLRVGSVIEGLAGTLSREGFLEDSRFAAIKGEKETAFASASRRSAVHAGSAYPAEARALGEVLDAYMTPAPGDPAPREGAEGALLDGLVGIAAPHVSPEGGWRAYRAAYAALGPEHRNRTFVILGTSHYGTPERFGLTRKPFSTPFGDAQVDLAVVDELAAAAGDAVEMEDYCHSVEHSIEFQVVFLQHLFGPRVHIVPVLCGSFGRSTMLGGRPEDDGRVARFLDALTGLHAREGGRLFYVLGVDMAHVGHRYGDAFSARAGRGPLEEVERRDRLRMARLVEGDAEGFWADVQVGGDELRWCGSSPLYTFLRAVPSRAELIRYEQWNIDDRSVVSFAGLAFRRPAGGRTPGAA